MSDDVLKLTARMEAVLVKWDASVGENPPVGDPSKHPECIEVIKLTEGQQPEILYRREPC